MILDGMAVATVKTMLAKRLLMGSVFSFSIMACGTSDFDVIFTDIFESPEDWTINAEPDYMCPGENQLCGDAEASLSDARLVMSAGCDAIGGRCPRATAARSLPELDIDGEFEIRAEFERLGGNGTFRTCAAGRCATVRWTVEDNPNSGVPSSKVVEDVKLAASKSGRFSDIFDVTFEDDTGDFDAILIESCYCLF